MIYIKIGEQRLDLLLWCIWYMLGNHKSKFFRSDLTALILIDNSERVNIFPNSLNSDFVFLSEIADFLVCEILYRHYTFTWLTNLHLVNDFRSKRWEKNKAYTLPSKTIRDIDMCLMILGPACWSMLDGLNTKQMYVASRE